ncbi:putative RNA methyltransferase [Nocardia sp. BMG51109]|uniref:putative RNA methyltransferase n=1 Tax=Nocardia sp. BMG51109 TaxID=1056816 RepID=UPI0004B3389B|nr:methyltransferase domain-containing protein [Nocardia sp. BMG51109]
MPVNPARADPHLPLAAIARLLACPECGAAMALDDRSLSCARRHAFDLARQGYVSLLTGASTKMTGDTADMLDARAAFQRARYFGPIADAVTAAVTSTTPARAILEIGAGTGYYLAETLDAAPEAHGIAVDVSKPAARRCARAHPRAASVLADAWRGLPVRDDALTHVLSVFAPRNPEEVARVLAPGGVFVIATPTPRHLSELITPLGMVSVDAAKDDRLTAALSGHFTAIDRTPVEYTMTLDHTAITNVAAMGPSAHHAATERTGRIATLPDEMQVTASVTVTTYRAR